MATSVFISYAAKDPDWPIKTVLALAEALKLRSVIVLLDHWHLQTLGRTKLAEDEWRRWMKSSVKHADRVVCLASPRYLQAVEADIGEAWGYGVAYESLQLIHQLYQGKGHNDGRILVAIKDGARPDTCVPDDFRPTCPIFRFPVETKDLINDASRPDTSIKLTGELSTIRQQSKLSDLNSQQLHVLQRLNAAPEFLQDLLDDFRLKAVFGNENLPSGAVELLRQLADANKQVAHKVMLAVRRVLIKYSRSNIVVAPNSREAAVGIYMLCGTRWVQASVPKCDPDSVVKVPDMLLNPIAVLSAALFGGVVYLRADSSGQARASHVYEVNANSGEDSSLNLMLAIYGALYPERKDAMDFARKDALTSTEVDRLLAAIRGRITDIREVQESCFALVVDAADVLEAASWTHGLNLHAFSRNRELAKDLFVISPDDLDVEINHLWGALEGFEFRPGSSESHS